MVQSEIMRSMADSVNDFFIEKKKTAITAAKGFFMEGKRFILYSGRSSPLL